MSRVLESVASSKIEGLEVGARRLLRAEAARGLGDAPSDVTALEVLGNIDAMVAAIRSADEGEPMTIALLLDLHRRLLAGTRLEAHGGRLREVQNWIGGSDYNPCSAAFVPAPPELVEHLMVDLVAFSNSDTLPAVAQAAVAHAQFETIHPFVDGNGRTGRALIHLILRRRGLTVNSTVPVSAGLLADTDAYFDALTRYRSGEAESIISMISSATVRAVANGRELVSDLRSVRQGWDKRLRA